MKKFDYIDSIRAIAILSVLLIHNGQYGSHLDFIPSRIQSLILSGEKGVQLFFLASAYTIYLSYSNRINTEKNATRNFFIRRFFRIAPMYYVGIIYYLFQNGRGPNYWLGNASGISDLNIVFNFLFLHGFNPYWINSLVPGGWSIAVEVIFYCFVPLIFVYVKNAKQAFNFLILSVLFRFIILFVFNHYALINDKHLWSEYLNLFFPSQLPIFCLGIVMYHIISDNYKINISPKSLFLAGLIFIAQLSTGLNILSDDFIFSCAFFILFVALSRYSPRILINPVFKFIGKLSFSMYLVHFAVYYWLSKINFIDYIKISSSRSAILNFSVRYFIVLILSIIISTLFYNLVENPMQKLGKRLISSLDN